MLTAAIQTQPAAEAEVGLADALLCYRGMGVAAPAQPPSPAVPSCRCRLPRNTRHPAQPIPDRGQHAPNAAVSTTRFSNAADRSALQRAAVGNGRGFPGLTAMPESGA